MRSGFYLYAPRPADAFRVEPSGNNTVIIRPANVPFFTGCMVTVTLSPVLNENLLQPPFTIVTGFCVSPIQCTALPSSPATSNCNKQCGFDHIQAVTVPFSVSVLAVSKAAAPWCANKGTATLPRT